jgi:sugar lactone lactonase YvrE
MIRLRPEPAYPAQARLAEGPVWDADLGQLLFVDIFNGRLHRTRPDGGIDTLVELDEYLGAALPADDGTVLLAAASGFLRLDTVGRVEPLLLDLADRPDLRFNDAKCDPAGRAFAGTASTVDATAACALFRLDDGPRTHAVVTGVGLSNGLGWSPGGTTLYYADTLSGRIDQFHYDIETGAVHNRAPFVAEKPGTPDGLCVDDEGAVWLALWEGGELHRYSPDGVLIAIVEMPVPHITSCAFGGSDGRTLFITTARPERPPDVLRAAPHSGDIFAVATGVSGSPAPRWHPVLSA